MHFAGVDDRPAAEALRGVRLFVAAAERPALDDPDEFYDTDLVGLDRAHGRRRRLGPVRDVVHAGGADYLVLDVDGPRAAGAVRRRPSCPTVDVGRPGRGRRPARGPVRPMSAPARSTSSRSSPTTSRRCGSRCSARPSSAARCSCRVHDLRRWTDDVHRTVDDTPYGGGPGMVMRPEPWGRALDATRAGRARPQPRLIVPTPGGRAVHPGRPPPRLAAEPWLLFACGRYEGIDARVVRVRRAAGCRSRRSRSATTCWPGERWPSWSSPRRSPGCCPACSATTARPSTTRSPRGRAACSRRRSTPSRRPGAASTCPTVLLSGNHAAIARWRRERSRERTAARTGPDLLLSRTGAGFGDAAADVASSWGCPLRSARRCPCAAARTRPSRLRRPHRHRRA